MMAVVGSNPHAHDARGLAHARLSREAPAPSIAKRCALQLFAAELLRITDFLKRGGNSKSARSFRHLCEAEREFICVMTVTWQAHPYDNAQKSAGRAPSRQPSLR